MPIQIKFLLPGNPACTDFILLNAEPQTYIASFFLHINWFLITLLWAQIKRTGFFEISLTNTCVEWAYCSIMVLQTWSPESMNVSFIRLACKILYLYDLKKINLFKAKEAVTPLCKKDAGLAVYLRRWRYTHVQCRNFCVVFHLFAATNSTGTENTGYSDFQQEIVLHKLNAVPELSCAPCIVCIAQSLFITNYEKYMAAITIGGKVQSLKTTSARLHWT